MEQEKLTKGFCYAVRANLSKFALTFWLAIAAASPVFAYGFWVDQTQYINMISPYGEPTYQIVHKAMEKLYKKTEKIMPYPVIAVAETDLNGDKFPEIISYPLESEEFQGEFCDAKTTLCPHYVLEVRDDQIKTLGVIYSRYVSRGPDVVNGYWTLKVYNKGEKDPKYFDIYAYDPKKDAYVPRPKP